MTDPRWIIPFAANLLLIVLNRELNHYLATLGLSLTLAGLALPLTALRLSTLPGLLAVVLTGLAIDSLNDTAFGSTAVLFATCHLVLRAIRHRLARDSVPTHLAIALLANLALFFAQPLFSGSDLPHASPTVLRVVVDLLFSQVVLIALAWWFFALQERALVLWGVNLAEEMRQQR